MLVRIVDGKLAKRSRVRLLSSGRDHDVTLLGVPQLRVNPIESIGAGEVGVVAASIRDPKAVRIGDTLTDAAPRRERPAARLQADAADGLERALPRRHRQLRGAARGAREAAAQRLVDDRRARDQRRARLRLPLRLPGPLAHGDRAGAARARVRARPDHHRADGGLPGQEDRRQRDRAPPPERSARRRTRSRRSSSRASSRRSTCRRRTSARCWRCARSAAACSAT